MTRLLRMTLTVMALWLSACADEVPLPHAEPLSVERSVVESLYGAAPGAFNVVSRRDLLLPEDGDARELPFNLYYPDAQGPFPVLLFSHGNWSNRDSYDRLINHWVSHGYVVVAPDHLDCCGMARGIFNSLRYGQYGLIAARIDDLTRLLDAVPSLTDVEPALQGKLDTTRIAMTGHSFGAFSAQQFGGAAALDPDSDSYVGALDTRMKAIVALSPPGPMFDVITERSWDALTLPNLATTGTWDIQPGFWPDWRDHLMSFKAGTSEDKFALVVEGADHFLGNLICRLEREAQPQDDALLMVRATTTAFLDHYVKGKPAVPTLFAAGWLDATTAGFARVLTRDDADEPRHN